jgi:alpha-L-fucosidase
MPRPLSAGGDTNTVSYSQLDKVHNWADASKVFKARFHEIIDRLGSDLVTEIWIDQPIRASLGMEIADRAPKAVVAAVGCVDPYPTIRWPGNEQGHVSDPCWSILKKSSIAKKPATQFEADKNQTQAADDPDGDYWAPHEADTPLHDKFWHFRPDALNHRKSLDELMDCYLKSVGRNSFLILNCAPMADGSIHPDDMKRYQEFGQEIERRFGHPIARVEKISGNEVLLKLEKPCSIAYTDLWEDFQYGQRIRSYEIEGREAATGKWMKIAEGTSVGRRKIDPIILASEVDQLKVKIKSSVGTPMIRKFQVHIELVSEKFVLYK